MIHKFQIGQMVAMRVGVVVHELSPRSGIPSPFIVLERITQECPGGTQLKYVIRGISIDGTTTVLECELDEWTFVTNAIRSIGLLDSVNAAKETAAADGRWDIVKRLKDITDELKRSPVATGRKQNERPSCGT